jgi:hypothetical protein
MTDYAPRPLSCGCIVDDSLIDSRYCPAHQDEKVRDACAKAIGHVMGWDNLTVVPAIQRALREVVTFASTYDVPVDQLREAIQLEARQRGIAA